MTSGGNSVQRGAESFGGESIGDVQTGLIERLTGPPALVEFELIDGTAIFEGDIILRVSRVDEPAARAVAITGDRFRWRNGVVPFRIDPNLPDQSRVTDAITHWEQNTSIRFVPSGSNPNFVTFQPSGGCSSSVGMSGNEQFVNLGTGCTTGNTIHEIGHAVGLWHEQSREDRDQFVTINWSNIQEGKEHNFNQQISDGDDIGPYDFGSIMHYGAFAFAKDTAVKTIVAPQPIGQRTGLSTGDKAAIRFLYYFRRRRDSGDLAGAVSEIAIAPHRTRQVITAVRTASATLKLISWRVNDDGLLARTGDSGDLAGAASNIDIAKGRDFVTACTTGSGDQKLISWAVTDAGAITRRADSGTQAGAATLNKIVALTDDLLVTACRTGSGSLKLISWRLAANGSLIRLHDSGDAAGATSEIAMVRVTGGQVATAVRTAQGTLKVIVWNIALGGAVSRVGDSGDLAGEARMIRIVRDAAGHLITSVRAGNGSLKLISWGISAGGQLSRLGDSGDQAGAIGDNALMARAPGVISAVRAADGHLKLIAWKVDGAGSIERAGDSYNLAGEATLITLCPTSLTGSTPIISAARTGAGTVKLIGWDD